MDKKNFKYLFGPVPSRRLGRSLGVSPIPPKTCNFSCIYCQLGRTTNFTNKREEFYPVEEIVDELKEALKQNIDIDYITIVGDGEPTLYKELGELISAIKKLSTKPVAIITNGALLYQKEVRADLLEANVVMPTLDAFEANMFRAINRPHKELELNKIIQGMKTFREEYKNQIWLEVMLVKDLNDSSETLKGIKKLIDFLEVDKTFINIPIRPPAEKWVKIPTQDRLIAARKILGAESISHYDEILIESVDSEADPETKILDITQRHPLREEQVFSLFPDFPEVQVLQILKKMETKGILELRIYNKKRFWEIPKDKNKKNKTTKTLR
ncbi:MAG: radical SAM protein [Candidatus Heimdallarchaeota archaeon]|nr:radical SAM protein [Candidatus Heimdallarchaeota archaeon]MCK4613091.1 radical SAM protein [Candidatus Heimdallarchaeota archaeon]